MGDRADRLRRELKVETLTGSARALADEACLVLERLEELDKILQGDADVWLGVQSRLGADVAEVTINAPLAEVRQQGLALKALLAEYAKLQGVEVPAPPASKADELAKRRMDKRGQAG